MIRRTYAIMKKEVYQLLRDTRMLFVILFFPVFLLGIFGYAVNFDVKHVKLGIYDQAKNQDSRKFLNSLVNSEYFDISKYISSNNEVTNVLERKQAQAILVIPTDFSYNYNSNKEISKIQVLVDGVDGNTATIIKNYLEAAVFKYDMGIKTEQMQKRGVKFIMPVAAEPLFWFNPNLESTWYLLPGLIAMILIVTAVISVSLTMVREKERGTIEQINVSSIKTIELLAGKSMPYIVLAFLNAIIILIAGNILFGITVKGSLLLLFSNIFIFILASISIGIFVSVISNSQQIAFTVSTFVSMLPSIILSGFIFPIESMPVVIQILTNITPAKFFLKALRAIMLKGAPLSAFWEQWVYLLGFTFLFLFLAAIINTKNSNIKVRKSNK